MSIILALQSGYSYGEVGRMLKVCKSHVHYAAKKLEEGEKEFVQKAKEYEENANSVGKRG